MPKRIPISAAREIASAHGCRQVILIAWDGDLTHVVTYGKTAEDCDQAAMGGDRLKALLGWPETLNSKPSRLKAAKSRAETAEAALQRAREALTDIASAKLIPLRPADSKSYDAEAAKRLFVELQRVRDVAAIALDTGARG